MGGAIIDQPQQPECISKFLKLKLADMRLPHDLIQAIESELAGHDLGALAKAAGELSQDYRAQTVPQKRHISSDERRLAYLLTRLPATYAANWAVFNEINRICEDTAIESMVDLGAGPGTAMWAAREVFTELKTITLVEQDSDLIDTGRRLAQASDNGAIRAASWTRQNLKEAGSLKPADLVNLSYVLGELDNSTRRTLLEKAYQLAHRLIVIIEPGSKTGYAHILAAREFFISAGAHIVAPCPHASACPLMADDWCHFSQRVERTSWHRRAKAGTLSYEDEKYSYIVVAKFPIERPQARIIRTPIIKMGHLHLDLCTPAGVQRQTLSKKEKEIYKQARKSDWGDPWPPRS